MGTNGSGTLEVSSVQPAEEERFVESTNVEPVVHLHEILDNGTEVHTGPFRTVALAFQEAEYVFCDRLRNVREVRIVRVTPR